MLDFKKMRQDTLGARRNWNNFIHSDKGDANKEPRVGIAGSFTVEPIVPYLGDELLKRGFSEPGIVVAPYNQVFQTCLDPFSAFGGDVDFIIILARIEDLFPSELIEYVNGENEALARALEKIGELARAVNVSRSKVKESIILSIPPYPDSLMTDLRNLRVSRLAATFHRRFTSEWVQVMGAIDGLYFFDFDSLERHFGAGQAHDTRKWYLYKQPYSEEFCYLIGQDLARILSATKGVGKKCIVVDCDNTLWGGIVGEDGIEGIELGSDFPGNAYLDFQKQLIELHRQGLLLAIVSKNNEADVWEIFDNHDAMLLKREHLAAWRINWEPKPKNIEEIAIELNLGLDSFVFVDDSDFEIDSVRQLLPEVTCIQVPEDISFLPEEFNSQYLFDRLTLTREDSSRTAMMREEKVRQSASQSMTQEDFLASLGLTVEIFLVENNHLNRVTQLTNKTNQFNLTTIRHSKAEIEEMANRSDCRIYAIRAKDRFGDYGLIGTTIVKIADSCWEIENLLLSCRILGRGVESALIAKIAEDAKKNGVEEIKAAFILTKKNKPAQSFLPDHGFRKEGEYQWYAAPDVLPKIPAHIKVK